MKPLLILLLILSCIYCKSDTNKTSVKSEYYNNSIISNPPLETKTITIGIRYHYLINVNSNINYDGLIKRVNLYNNNLNFAFKNVIKFKWNQEILIHPFDTLTLNNLYNESMVNGTYNVYGSTIKAYSQTGYYNVYIVRTNFNVFSDILLGFTPVLNSPELTDYSVLMPKFDNTFIAYESIVDDEYLTENTLIHETGHWLSLDHPWELSDSMKIAMGLNSKSKYCINYMNYNCYTSEFTNQQLNKMYYFAKNYRKYLVN